ncbi:MAG: hypothetical protein LBL08_00850 [Candidatus Nomurabacteria bacterium]|jgi:antitoxin component of RelBE/YafQ-DinJ toxin-antitoxin module|nr:hypothetical protein [Candidatus Nomurabacteria bacterium]
MTTITIRTDDTIKDILAHNAKMNGLTLSGYLNVVFRQYIFDDEPLEIDDKRMRKELAIAHRRANDPCTEYIDAKVAIKELGKKYGV